MRIIIYALLLLLAGCKPPVPPTAEDIARSKVKEYILTNTRNPKTYEPIEWGTLDSMFTTSNHKIDSLEKVVEICNITIDMYFKMSHLTGVTNWMNSLKKTNAQLREAKQSFIPEYIGWRLRHKYRAANEFGVLDIYEQTFTLDIDMLEVEQEVEEKEGEEEAEENKH